MSPDEPARGPGRRRGGRGAPMGAQKREGAPDMHGAGVHAWRPRTEGPRARECAERAEQVTVGPSVSRCNAPSRQPAGGAGRRRAGGAAVTKTKIVAR